MSPQFRNSLSNGPVADVPPGIETLDVSQCADNALVLERFDLEEGGAYLVRPDQYVAARFRRPIPEAIEQARARACGEAA